MGHHHLETIIWGLGPTPLVGRGLIACKSEDDDMSEMILRVEAAVAEVIAELGDSDLASRFGLFLAEHGGTIGQAAIKAMRELPENAGSRYSAGEYSRRNAEAMIDDALSR